MTENKPTKPKGTGKRKQTLTFKATGLDPEVFNPEWDRLPDSVKGKLASKELADLILRFAELSDALKNNREKTGEAGRLRPFLSGVDKRGKNGETGRKTRKKPVQQRPEHPFRSPWQPLREAFLAVSRERVGRTIQKALSAFLHSLTRRGFK